MIIDSNDPMQPLDKYGNPQKMANPYGTFKTHVQPDETLDGRITNNINNMVGPQTDPTKSKNVLAARIDNNIKDTYYQPYSQKLLKEAYSNLHPRKGVTVSMNYQIRNMKRQQIAQYANEAGKYLSQIHDSDNMTLNPENIWNLPDIAKDHEYWTDKQGRAHISPDDFLDLNGKSDKHLQWDANFWQKKAIGDQTNKSQQRNDKDFENEMNRFNYHAQKFDKYKYSHSRTLTPQERRIHENTQYNYMKAWKDDLNSHYQHGSKSWLAKIYMARGWYNYHVDKLSHLNFNHGYYNAKNDKAIDVQVKLVRKWKNQLNNDIKHKNQDYNYYQKYLQQYRQNKYQEMMNQHWQEIRQQVAENQANSFTSIYRADGMDTRVVRVAEITPTEDTSMNVPTKSIDDGMPQNDFVNISQSQLSGQYTIYLPSDYPINFSNLNYGSASPSYNDRVAQYHILKRWAEEGKLLAIEGFNSWHSILISDVSRTADTQSSANGLQMNITFQYARLAHIKYAKNKKAPSRPMRGRHQSSNRGVTVKANDTFWGFAHRYGGTVGEWKRANPHAVARDLQIGSKLNKPSEAK